MDQTTPIFISLGSNIDAEVNLSAAIATLTRKLNRARVSHIYRSPAVGMTGDDFLNAVVGGETALTHQATITWLRDIEHSQGRIRTENKYTDRTLDLDLLLYGNLSNKELPHQEITEQAYVLQPLSDIAADLIHPTKKQSIRELRESLSQKHEDKFRTLMKVELPQQLL